ncbi:hypothetical protein, unlikely [Trypanosoma congolense IL3000]|uniref:Uncharacterized protein n=1 Tax=Trypanosoma congolense (strain IL3000) TaxID=1068625 RepID=F9W535_TRYCI|nr:hypothetical protein, unlikely [Trypanosoma congolense IL3000]
MAVFCFSQKTHLAPAECTAHRISKYQLTGPVRTLHAEAESRPGCEGRFRSDRRNVSGECQQRWCLLATRCWQPCWRVSPERRVSPAQRSGHWLAQVVRQR